MKILKTILFLQVLAFSFGAMAADKPSYEELENRVKVLEHRVNYNNLNNNRFKLLYPFYDDKFFKDFDRMFEDHRARMKAMFNDNNMSSFSVDRNDEKITIKAKLPGMSKKDIDVLVKDDILTIKSNKQEQKEVKNEKEVVKSSNYSSFLQQVSLPKNTDIDKIQTSFEKELLTITIPIDKNANEVKKLKL